MIIREHTPTHEVIDAIARQVLDIIDLRTHYEAIAKRGGTPEMPFITADKLSAEMIRHEASVMTVASRLCIHDEVADHVNDLLAQRQREAAAQAEEE